MRTAQPTRPAVRARMFWPRQPASRVPQAPANAAGRLPYVPLGCACLFLLGYLPGIWLGRTGAWESGSQLAAYYLSKSSYSTVFSVWQWQFSAAFLQLAALYLCSFSALGCFFFPILFGTFFHAIFLAYGLGWGAVLGISAVSATFSCSFQAFWLGLGCCFGDFCGFSSTRPACYAINLWLLYIMPI